MVHSKHSDRISLKEFEFKRLANGRCRARVVLAWPEGDEFVSTSEAENTQTGRLQCAVEATARALEQSVNDETALEVVGVHMIAEAETMIVITVLSGRALGEAQQLLGSCIVGKQPERSAAMSVLKATNRLVFNVRRSS